MLHSTETGIHGQRDPGTGTSTSLGTSGNDSRLTDTTRGSNLGTSTTGGDTSLGHGSTLGGTGSGTYNSMKLSILKEAQRGRLWHDLSCQRGPQKLRWGFNGLTNHRCN